MQSSKLNKYTVFYENSEEYHHLKQEIFTQDLYYFESENPTPVIIDAGAYIGLSTLYFKYLFPAAQIIAIEPNPSAVQILETNIFENQISGVTIIQAALSDSQLPTTLHRDANPEKWHSAASIHKGAWTGTQKSEIIETKAHLLSEFITQPIDFLKLDIEGAEQSVLKASQESLSLIKEMHIEFHPHTSQKLETIMQILEETHKLEFYSGTTEILAKRLLRTPGLIQIRATRH